MEGHMRVFISITQDLKKAVPFQRMLPYILDKLKEQSLTPARYLFAFQDVPNTKNQLFSKTSMGKLVKAFPRFEDYLWPHSEQRPCETTASNFPAVSGLTYVQQGIPNAITPEMLTAVAEKIPKPYSFYSSTILLDAIPWFGDSNPEPALSCGIQDVPCATDGMNLYNAECSFYQSDSIVLAKCFDYGTNYNPMHLRFEVTPFIETDMLEQMDEQIEKISALFGGKRRMKQMVCCFPPEEIARFDAAAKQMELFLQKRSEAWAQLPMPSGIPFDGGAYQSVANAPKNKDFQHRNTASYFKKILKENGFLWHHPKINGYCDFGKIVPEGNYALNISTELRRGDSLHIYLRCSGYNFFISHVLASDRPCHSMYELELYTSDLKKVIQLWESEVVPEIRRLFGDTPDWYAHSIHYDNYIGCTIRNQP